MFRELCSAAMVFHVHLNHVTACRQLPCYRTPLSVDESSTADNHLRFISQQGKPSRMTMDVLPLSLKWRPTVHVHCNEDRIEALTPGIGHPLEALPDLCLFSLEFCHLEI